MTTSNPVVPRLEAVVDPNARHSRAVFREYRSNTRLSLWPLSDLASIVLTVTLFLHLAIFLVPVSVQDFAMRFPGAPTICASACILLFWTLGVYSPLPSPLNVYETEQLLRAMSIIAVVAALVISHLGLRLVLGVLIVSSFIALLLIGQRGFVRRLLLPLRHEHIRALLYTRTLDSDLFKAIHTISGNSIEFAGLLYDSPWELKQVNETPCRFVGTSEEVKRAARQTGASHLLIIGFDAASRKVQRILQDCDRLKLQCAIVLDPRSLPNTRPAYTFMHELPILQRWPIGPRAQFTQLKRLIDLVVGSCLLIVALPIGVLISAAVKYDSRGPIFFRQERIGKDGQPFELLKFRTMHTWSPKYHRSPSSTFDARITRIGGLLRRLSLDELPQLLNVLKGDMSLVGPRPEMPFIVEQYSDAASARLAVLPGITGLWQISRARSLPIHHNLHYDLFYIERRSIFLDAAILLRTVGAVVRGIGAA